MNETCERLQRCTGILSTQSGDETILVRVEDGNFFGLGETGSLVWARLAELGTLLDVTRYLEAACDGMPENAECEVAAFVEELRRERLIEAAPSTAVESGAPIQLRPRTCKQIYQPPRLDRGTLRRAASGMSTFADGGLTECGGPDGAS